MAALGVHDTGTTQMRNSVIITSAGLIFGGTRDGKMRAWDADTGKPIWSSPIGGSTTGQPAMFEVDGRQYLLMGVAAPGTGRGGGGAPAEAPAAGAAPGAPAGRGRVSGAGTPVAP